MTEVMQDLLIDFDEMGFAPTTLCPNPDKYACKWKAKLVAEINFLQEQLEATIAGQETLQKSLAEKDREVERLNKEVDRLSQCVLYHDGQIEDAKSEAVRAFAERLKSKKTTAISCDYLFEEVVRKSSIDNLVKEMAGED